MDWFHGGLNLHSPHHLFPRMPRNKYRKAHQLIVAAAARHDVKASCHVTPPLASSSSKCSLLLRNVCMRQVHVLSWTGAIVQTLRHLRKMQTLFSIDPR